MAKKKKVAKENKKAEVKTEEIKPIETKKEEPKPTAEEVANTCLGMNHVEAKTYIAEAGYVHRAICEDKRTIILVVKNEIVVDTWVKDE